MMRYLAVMIALALIQGLARADDPPNVEPLLHQGKLAEAEEALQTAVKADAKDDASRFALGVTHVLRAVERVAQALHRYGLRENMGLGFVGVALPIAKNENPQKIRAGDLRGVVQKLITDLQSAEATLAMVEGKDTKLLLHIGLVRLDLNGDGKVDENESLYHIYSAPRNRAGRGAGLPRDVLLALDRADATWLRGYCHLLMATCEIILAHDFKDLFERTAHVAFPNVDSPYPFLHGGRAVFRSMGPEGPDIMDLVAAVHLIRLPVTEPKRMTVAREHVKATISLSRAMWRFILEEKDNDHEWIPGPGQDTVIPGVRVTESMVQGWHEFLDEATDLLDGRKLLPFWRGDGTKGVNLRRVFTEPREIDLVLWVQGSAAAPYLEDGPLTKPDTWQRFNRLYGGSFFGFAVWLN
jgi:hypothetical protein